MLGLRSSCVLTVPNPRFHKVLMSAVDISILVAFTLIDRSPIATDSAMIHLNFSSVSGERAAWRSHSQRYTNEPTSA